MFLVEMFLEAVNTDAVDNMSIKELEIMENIFNKSDIYKSNEDK